VTLATNDSYSLGALVLGHSLRRVGTPHDLVVLVTPGVSAAMRYVQIILVIQYLYSN
jgi:glycogenin glucosyltransferase